jgi:hypothetical protein
VQHLPVPVGKAGAVGGERPEAASVGASSGGITRPPRAPKPRQLTSGVRRGRCEPCEPRSRRGVPLSTAGGHVRRVNGVDAAQDLVEEILEVLVGQRLLAVDDVVKIRVHQLRHNVHVLPLLY